MSSIIGLFLIFKLAIHNVILKQTKKLRVPDADGVWPPMMTGNLESWFVPEVYDGCSFDWHG